VEANDGAMLGCDALLELTNAPLIQAFPTPVLVLISGHKIELDPGLGIVVAQKPVKQSVFTSILEARATDILHAGLCELSVEDIDSLVNRHGSQIFIRDIGDD